MNMFFSTCQLIHCSQASKKLCPKWTTRLLHIFHSAHTAIQTYELLHALSTHPGYLLPTKIITRTSFNGMHNIKHSTQKSISTNCGTSNPIDAHSGLIRPCASSADTGDECITTRRTRVNSLLDGKTYSIINSK